MCGVCNGCYLVELYHGPHGLRISLELFWIFQQFCHIFDVPFQRNARHLEISRMKDFVSYLFHL